MPDDFGNIGTICLPALVIGRGGVFSLPLRLVVDGRVVGGAADPCVAETAFGQACDETVFHPCASHGGIAV